MTFRATMEIEYGVMGSEQKPVAAAASEKLHISGSLPLLASKMNRKTA